MRVVVRGIHRTIKISEVAATVPKISERATKAHRRLTSSGRGGGGGGGWGGGGGGGGVGGGGGGKRLRGGKARVGTGGTWHFFASSQHAWGASGHGAIPFRAAGESTETTVSRRSRAPYEQKLTGEVALSWSEGGKGLLRCLRSALHEVRWSKSVRMTGRQKRC